jgi:hypothetical protein
VDDVVGVDDVAGVNEVAGGRGPVLAELLG